MKPTRMTRAQIEAAFAKHGLKMAQPDDPIYSEGPSITFSSHTQKQSQPRVTHSPYSDLQSDSDSVTPSDS